jgi:hypothetical protein
MIQLNKLRQHRLEIFFDQLSKSTINISDDHIKSNEFIHKYILTLKYVLDTQQKEKIEMFANIFKNSLSKKNNTFNVDTYEDFSKMLNELSYREICALSIFEYFYTNRKKEKKDNELQFVFSFWNEFEDKIEQELGISKTSVENYMIKISRTGCYKEITGGYLDYNGGKGILTPMYFELKDCILNQS